MWLCLRGSWERGCQNQRVCCRKPLKSIGLPYLKFWDLWHKIWKAGSAREDTTLCYTTVVQQPSWRNPVLSPLVFLENATLFLNCICFLSVMLLCDFVIKMKNTVRDTDLGTWNTLPFILMILSTRNYSDMLVHDYYDYANGYCTLTCCSKSSVSSTENHCPWGTIFCLLV